MLLHKFQKKSITPNGDITANTDNKNNINMKSSTISKTPSTANNDNNKPLTLEKQETKQATLYILWYKN